jgi:hypothetical protein
VGGCLECVRIPKITLHVVFNRDLGQFLIRAKAMDALVKSVFTAPLATVFIIAVKLNKGIKTVIEFLRSD